MTTPTASKMGPLQWGLLLALSAIWGGAFFFNGVALRGFPPLLVVFGRVLVGGIGLSFILKLSGTSVRPHLGRWPEFLALALINTVLPFSLIAWGQQHISSGLASVINATTPAFTILVAHFTTTDERASVNKFLGAALGMGGVAVLIGADALQGVGDHVTGELAVMGATFCYACATSFIRRFAGVPPLVVATGQMLSSAVILLPFVLFVVRPWQLPTPGVEVFGAVIGLGLICSAMGYSIFLRLLSTAGGTNANLVTLLIPFSATTLGILFLDEPFTLRLVIGMVIVSTAALLIDGRIRLWRQRS